MTTGTEDLDLVEEEGLALIATAESIQVRDQATFTQAADFLRAVKQHLKRIGEVLDPIIQAAHQAHKTATEQRRKLEAGPKAAEDTIKRSMGNYEAAQRREKALSEARAAQEAAILAEPHAKAAEAAIQAGRPVPPPVPIVVPAVQVEVPKADGVSFRDHWTWVVTDKVALIAAVAAGKLAPDVLDVNSRVMGDMVRSMKGRFDVPGVKVTLERIAGAKAE